MFSGRPLFPGKTNEDELIKIFRILGTPTEASWPGITEYPEYKEYASFPSQSLQSVILNLDQYALDLLVRMLQYIPNLRISAREALSHPYFVNVALPNNPMAPSPLH
jgi:negative regulator of PHO system